jgi:hypothetical protein
MPTNTPLKSNFFITGYPRIRSAWLAAMITANGTLCIHDYRTATKGKAKLLAWLEDHPKAGIADPCLASLEPDFALKYFKDLQCAVILRPFGDCKKSYEAWSGKDVAVDHWKLINNNYRNFIENLNPKNVMYVPFKELDHYPTTDKLVQHLTGKPLNRDIFKMFNLMKVEQHFTKAMAY